MVLIFRLWRRHIQAFLSVQVGSNTQSTEGKSQHEGFKTVVVSQLYWCDDDHHGHDDHDDNDDNDDYDDNVYNNCHDSNDDNDDNDGHDNYRVVFWTGPAQKSSKYGTGPTQERKMTKFAEDGKNPY